MGKERTFNVLLSCIKQSKPDHEIIAILWICYQVNLLLISESSHSSKVQFSSVNKSRICFHEITVYQLVCFF